MAVAKHYFKEDVRAVGIDGGDPTRTTDADGNIVLTTTTNGANANVKWKDKTIADQPHPGLKVGSQIIRHKDGSYEIVEAA